MTKYLSMMESFLNNYSKDTAAKNAQVDSQFPLEHGKVQNMSQGRFVLASNVITD